MSPHKVKWFWMVYSLMKRITKPGVESIRNLTNFPNVGIPPRMYDMIVKRTNEAIEMLDNEKGYKDLK